MSKSEDADELVQQIVTFRESRRELTPKLFDPQDPNDPVRLRYQSNFLNAIANASDTRVTDALAGEPFRIFSKYGQSRQLDETLLAWSRSFGIDLDFVLDAAKRTVRRWQQHPSTFARRSWALSAGSGWTDTPPINALEATPQKRDRTGRGKYVAFEWLVLQHVFGRSSRQLAGEYDADYSDVCKQINWAASQLGISRTKPKSGRPRGAKTGPR